MNKRTYEDRVLQIVTLCKKLKECGIDETFDEFKKFKGYADTFIETGETIDKQFPCTYMKKKKMVIYLSNNKNTDCSISILNTLL